MSRRRVLVFAKYPEPGRVKTRLAAAIGDEAAAAVHRACVELTLERVSAFQSEAVVCVNPPEALRSAREWLGPGWRLQPQIGETLGERLSRATAETFAEGAARVVVIGTDSPWLGAAEIEQAFAALTTHELVLGPTEDGGYYLIGLSRPLAGLFEDIAWGSSSVCAQTHARAQALGLTTARLPTGYDLDHVDDVRRFVGEVRADARASPWVGTLAALVDQRRPVCPS